jgi:hypothetical protein
MTENGEKESELAKPFIPSENEVNMTLPIIYIKILSFTSGSLRSYYSFLQQVFVQYVAPSF